MARNYVTGRWELPDGPVPGVGGVEQLDIADTQSLRFGDNEVLYFGDAFDVSIKWDGSNLKILPVADDTGAILIGNGTLDIDLKVFLGTAGCYFLCDVGKSEASVVVAGTVPINEASVGVTNAIRALYIGYSPTFDSDLEYAAASALVVEMSPTADGATGGNRANAIYARITHPTTSKAVQGCSAAGEFEQVHAASVIVQASYGVIRLVDRNDGVTCSANRSFIMVRDYSITAYQNPNFINFWNYPALTLSAGKLMTLADANGAGGEGSPYNAAIRCIYGSGSTPIWLMASTIDPTGRLDLKFFGSASGNYLWWDADEDILSLYIGGRTVTGEEHALDILFAGTVAATADQMVGLNVRVLPAGAHSDWVSAIYAKVTMPATTRPVDGYVSAAELEVIHTAGVAVQCAYYILNLNENNGGVTVSAVRAYIGLNDYSVAAYRQPNLFHFKSAAGRVSPADDDVILTEPGVVRGGTFNVAVRNMFGTTPFWILGTTTVPEAFADLKVMGSVDTNYLEWDASADKFSLVTTKATVTGTEYCAVINSITTLDAGTEGIVGLRIDMAPTGPLAIFGGALRAVGLWSVVTLVQGGGIGGYSCAGEFDVISTGDCTILGLATYYVIKLASRCTLTGGAAVISPRRAFIDLRDTGVGELGMENLFLFENEAVACAYGDDRMLVASGDTQAVTNSVNVMVRCMVGDLSTPIWLMATTIAPTAMPDWKFVGTTANNYMLWDASEDKLNVVVTKAAITAGVETPASIAFTATMDAYTEGMVGLLVNVTPLGTGGVYGTGALRAVGIWGLVTVASTSIKGYVCAAEFDVIQTGAPDAGGDARPEYHILKLSNRYTSTCTVSGSRSFIGLRDASSSGYEMPNLFNFMQESVASAWNSGRMVRLSGTPKAATHVVQCRVGGTDFYLIATTTAPTD